MTEQSIDQLLAIASGPLRADLACQLGLRAMEERREEDVLPLVSAAARQMPDDATLLHILGLLHRAIGDMAPAIAAFDKALAIAPDVARLIHARARAASEAGLPSLDWYQRARLLAPNDGDIILGQAAAFVAAGDGDGADALLASIIRQHPGWLPGHAALVRLRHAWGQERQDCLAELDWAIAGAPLDVRLHHLKIAVLHRAGFGEDAFTAIVAARRALGDAHALRSITAAVAAEYGAMSDADAAFDGLDPLSEPDLAVHWLRHLLRRREPERVAALAGRMPPAAAAVAWPYLSIAWRLLGDQRADWLDDARFVKIVDFGEDWPPLNDLAIVLRGLHLSRHQPLDQSVRGGTQTDGPLLSRLEPEIRALRTRLAEEVAAYIRSLPETDPAHPLLGRVPRHPRFVGSWSVRLTGGGFHEPHVHGEGWLSSAFYVDLPARGAGEAGWLTLGEPQSALGLDLPALRSIEPRRGRLVLFPATMWHGTRPFDAGERLTVAFDVA